MLRPHHIDKIVSQVTGIPISLIHIHRGNDAVCDARNLAMLKCKQWLKFSTIKIRKHYGKDSHTTVMSDIKSANNLIDTDMTARWYSERVDELIQAKILELKSRQQVYDLHYRLRKMGIPVLVKDKMLSVDNQYREKLEKSRTMKLIKQHGYVIQYSLF